MKILEYLETNIKDKMQLSEMVDIFEKMCQISIEADEDLLLFETGTYSFELNKPLFQFSFVRQFPNENEEYYQLHLDIKYQPNDKNKAFSEIVWNDEGNEDFFDLVRKSDSYLAVKDDEIFKVNIYLDQT